MRLRGDGFPLDEAKMRFFRSHFTRNPVNFQNLNGGSHSVDPQHWLYTSDNHLLRACCKKHFILQTTRRKQDNTMKTSHTIGCVVAVTTISLSLVSKVLTAPAEVAPRQAEVAPKQEGEDQVSPLTLSGGDMKAFVVAWNDFHILPDLPDEKKNLENYSILINSDVKNIYVIFQPITLPLTKDREGLENQVNSMTAGGDLSTGRWVSYTISKGDYKIVKRLYGM